MDVEEGRDQDAFTHPDEACTFALYPGAPAAADTRL